MLAHFPGNLYQDLKYPTRSNLAFAGFVHHPDQRFFELFGGVPDLLADVSEVPQGVGGPVEREV